ncbi:hypothetical protein LCGC14_1573450 [marine sediment metagenome]|uniref:Uncharacterized protein n=1 Tax=marine sediment metagenome TaxID=412755 RepID=A0A0F9IJ49_9ZZZZ
MTIASDYNLCPICGHTPGFCRSARCAGSASPEELRKSERRAQLKQLRASIERELEQLDD